MWTIVCLLIFLFLTFVLLYVGSGYTNVVFRHFRSLMGTKLSLYLVRILYFVVICIKIRLYQSNQAYSTTWQALYICKYQIPSVLHVVTYKTWICLVNDQFNQYQQNKPPPLTSKSLTTIKTKTSRYWLGTGTNTLLLILVALLTITVYTFFSKYLQFLLFKKTIDTNHQTANTKLKNSAKR